MGRFFDLDNGFFRFLNKVFDMLVLNFLVLLLCIPVVTAGPAIASMYYIALKEVRDEEGYVVKPFFKFFKKNFKQGLILELIVAAAAAVMTADVYVMYQWTQKESGFLLSLLFALIIGFALVCAVTAVYIFPMLAKFDNSVKKLVTNSLVMAIRHLPQSVLMVLIVAGCGVLVYINPISLLFAIGLAGYLTSLILVKIFDLYIPKEEHKDAYADDITDAVDAAEDTEVSDREDAADVAENDKADVTDNNADADM